MPTVQQVLAENDGNKACDLLFTVLGEVSEGKDLSTVVAEIAQGVLNSKWSVQVKRLAYELCKAVPLSDADSQFIIMGLRGDITMGEAEACVQAVKFMPHLQPHLLAQLLNNGELAQLVAPALVSDVPAIRSAAVYALGSVLLVPDVLVAAAGSAGIANQVAEHWQTINDALLDEEGDVVEAAIDATAALLKAGLSADPRMQEGFMLERLAAITASRVCAALGAVLHAAGEIQASARVSLLQLLQLLAQHAIRTAGFAPRDVGGYMGLPTGTMLPGLTSLAPSIWGVCTDLLRSGSPGVRFEAARTILAVATLVSYPRNKGQQSTAASMPAEDDDNIAAGPGSVVVPTPLLLDALHTLLDLEDGMPLVEAASEDVVSAAVAGLKALPRHLRPLVMHKLWQAIARLKLTAIRVQLCSEAWAILIEGDQEDSSSSTEDMTRHVSAWLSDTYLEGVLAGRITTVPQAASASGLYGAGAGGGGTAAPPSPGRSTSKGKDRDLATNSTAAPAAVAASTDELLARALPPTAPSESKGVKKSLFGFRKGKDTSSGVKELAAVPSAAPSLTASNSNKSYDGSGAAAAAAAAVASFQATLTRSPSSSEQARKQNAGPTFGALRHELAATLLSVLSQYHPAVPVAAQLCADVAGVTAADKAVHTALGSKYGSWQQQRILSWVAACRAALHATQGCLHWEPLVVPGITHQVNAANAQRPPADLSTSVADMWLQLLQASTAAARAVHTLNQHTQQAVPSLTMADSAQQPGGTEAEGLTSQLSDTSSVVSPRPSTASVMQTSAGNPLAQASTLEIRELNNIMKHVLRDYSNLSRSIRPRVLWVCCHALDMAPHADEQWELGLKALHDTLCRLIASSSAGRVNDLLSSASQGILYQSGRLGFPRDRPFVFDVVSASALCEKPDYEASALVVGLATAQTWTTRLQDALAASTPDSAKRVVSDVTFQASRLDAVMREFMGAADVPGNAALREWAKRIIRALAATAVFVHPAIRAQEEAEKAAKEAAEREEKAAAKAAAGLPDSDDDSSVVSDDSSSYAGDGGGNLLPVSLPTAMYLPPGAARPRPAVGPMALPAANAVNFGAGTAVAEVDRDTTANGFATGIQANPSMSTNKQDIARDQESFKTRAMQQYGNLPAHMVVSGSSHHPWGYPFSYAPRISTLFFSKRARRARLLFTHVGVALQKLQRGNASAHNTDMPPALPSHSLLRLDSPVFWASLPGGGLSVPASSSGTAALNNSPETSPSQAGVALVHTVELCGPGDPVMLVASVMRTPDVGIMLLRLTAVNRSDVDVRSASVQLTAQGPVFLDRRALNWAIPRLAPKDSASQSFVLRLLGYGAIHLQALLQLVMVGSGASVATPVLLPCKPVALGLIHHMMTSPHAVLAARDFFATWSTLPARMDISAAAVWPGREGAGLAISAMLRSPLSCSLLHYNPANTTYQAALAGETASGELVLILVHAQVLPAATNPASAGTPADIAGKQAANGTGDNAADEDDHLSPRGSVLSKRKSVSIPAQPSAKASALQEEATALADTARAPHAMLHIAVRSTIPDVTLAISSHPVPFLEDLTGGTAVLPGIAVSGAALQGGQQKPPMHPRVVALDSALHHSIRALPPTVQSVLGVTSNTTHSTTTLQPGGLGIDVYARGSRAVSKISHKWMEAAAAAEWQRLVAQPV